MAHRRGERGDCPHGVDTTAPEFGGCARCRLVCPFAGAASVLRMQLGRATGAGGKPASATGDAGPHP